MKRILVPTELTGSDQPSLAWAADLARRYDASILLYHALDVSHPLLDVDVDDVASRGRSRLERLASDLPVAADTALERSEDVAGSILDTIRQEGIDLVVMPSGTARAVRWFMVGSISERVMRHSPVPVLATDPRDERTAANALAPRSILVPTDFSADADHALREAAALAQEYDTILDVLHVCEEPTRIGFDVAGADSILSLRPELKTRYTEMIEERVKDLPVAAAAHVAAGKAATEIIAFATRRPVDLVAMATQGHDSISDRFLGSTTERVVRSLAQPILVVAGETVDGASAARPSFFAR